MKKILIAAALCLAVAVCLLVAGREEAPYETGHELCAYWMNNGAPEYISGYWFYSDNPRVAVIGVTDKGKIRQLRRQIEDKDSVQFVIQEHSLAKLQGILEEARSYPLEELGVMAILSDMNNCVKLAAYPDMVGNEQTRAFLEEMQERYGTAVVVEWSDEPWVMVPTGKPWKGAWTVSDSRWLPMGFLVMSMVLIVWYFLELQRRKRILLLIGRQPYAMAEVKQAVKNGGFRCPESLEEKIFEALRD